MLGTFFKRNSTQITIVSACALLLSAADCTPPDDDDDSTPPIDGNVRVVGGAAFETIQEAIDACPEGGSIIVNPGIYDEDLDINKPLSISGPSREQVLVTGGGAGTIVEIDQVDGLVQLTGMSFQAPYEELGTVRGFRITDSTDVLLHELNIGFAISAEGVCDHGLAGVEISQSTATVSSTDIVCIGFTSDNGGAGILAQTNSSVTVNEVIINGMGSFGVRAIDSSLSVTDSDISGINRPASAESYESDGSGIFVEQGTDEITISGTSISNGSFVGAWIEAPALTVTDSDFANFAYGVFHPGDAASASGRSTTVTGSTFTDLASEALLTFAAATVSTSVFRNKALVPDALNPPDNSGLRVVAPGAVVSVSGNSFENLGLRGVGVYGSVSDGKVEEVSVIGNTVTNIVGGNGIDIHHTELATISDNIVDGADHAYFDDDGGPNAGAIVNGYGIDCFNSTSCVLSNNTVTGGEFANFVIVNSGFSSTGDTASAGLRAGFHIQSSQGTFADLTISEQQGYGLYAFDVTLQATGGSISGVTRGPNIADLDGLNDPPIEEIENFIGGTGAYVVSQGAPTFISWTDGTFEGCSDNGMTLAGAQVELVGNRFTNNGYDDGSGFSADSTLEIYGVDELASSGPLIEGNIFDGGEGFQGIYLNDVPGLEFIDNTVCVGSSTALYVRDPVGGVISGNSIGSSEDETVTSCGIQDWNQSVYVSFSDPDASSEGVSFSDNSITGPMNYGLYLNGVGQYDLSDNTISDADSSGVYASAALPSGLTSDNDSDGLAEHNGDCNDTDPTIGGALTAEIPDDGIDNDCDGVADDGTSTDDLDGDGVTIADGDCNDTNPAIFPGNTEEVGNFIDDNCDGWADFDGVLPKPEVTMSGTTITGGSDGINSYGAAITLLEPGENEAGNSITDVGGEALMIRSWSWGLTPALSTGNIVAGAGTTLGPSGSDCVRVDGVGASVSLTGTTLQGCSSSGVYLAQDGTALVSGAVITDAGTAGIRASNGVLTVNEGTSISATTGSGLWITGGVADVDGLMVSGGTTVGVNLDGGALTLSTADIAGTTGHGIDVSAGSLTGAAGLGVSGAGGDGLYANGGTISLTGSSFANNTGAGISLDGDVSADLIDVVLDGNGGSGVLCDGGSGDPTSSLVLLNSCSATTSNNTGGDFDLTNGCELDWSCSAN